MTKRAHLPETNPQSRQLALDGWLVGWTSTAIVGWFSLPNYLTVGLKPKSSDARIECPADWELAYLRGSRSKVLVNKRADRLLADHGGPAPESGDMAAMSKFVATSRIDIFLASLMKAIWALVRPT